MILHNLYHNEARQSANSMKIIPTCNCQSVVQLHGRVYMSILTYEWSKPCLRDVSLRIQLLATNLSVFECLLCCKNKKLIRRWDSERELSLRRHCTGTKNTIDSCINSATDRFLQRKFTKFSEITQCNGHYAVQGHSSFGTNRKLIYDFLLVINSNLPSILHRYQVMADYWSIIR